MSSIVAVERHVECVRTFLPPSSKVYCVPAVKGADETIGTRNLSILCLRVTDDVMIKFCDVLNICNCLF